MKDNQRFWQETGMKIYIKSEMKAKKKGKKKSNS